MSYLEREGYEQPATETVCPCKIGTNLCDTCTETGELMCHFNRCESPGCNGDGKIQVEEVTGGLEL